MRAIRWQRLNAQGLPVAELAIMRTGREARSWTYADLRFHSRPDDCDWLYFRLQNEDFGRPRTEQWTELVLAMFRHGWLFAMHEAEFEGESTHWMHVWTVLTAGTAEVLAARQTMLTTATAGSVRRTILDRYRMNPTLQLQSRRIAFGADGAGNTRQKVMTRLLTEHPQRELVGVILESVFEAGLTAALAAPALVLTDH